MKVDGIEIVIESDAKKAIAELDKLIAKLGQASTAMQSVKGMKNASTGIKGTANSLKSYTGTANKAAKSTFSLASAFGKFYASCFLVIRGVKAIGRAIGSSMDYVETYNYFNVITDKIGTEFGSAWKENGYGSAEEYSKSFRDRLTDVTQKMTGFKIGEEGGLYSTDSIGLGIDPEEILNFQAKILSITNSVGMLGENSVNTASALTRLTADMSSLKNIDLDKVMDDFTSGLIGQSRALYKYGIDITNTTLQEYALANGISKKVSEMTQAEKMQLRMLAIMDMSKVSYGDVANSIGGVANQYRLFKQQVENLARTFGALFIPVLQKVLPYINGLVIALQRLFSWIGNMLFGASKWKKIMDGISTGYTDTGLDALNDDAEDVTKSLEDANKAASKLKKTVHGYDELHIATDNSSGSDSSKIGGSGGIDLSGQIADALADYESVWDEALSKMENKAQGIADKIIAAFKKGDYKEIGSFIGEKLRSALDSIPWQNVFNAAYKFGYNLANFLNGLITPELFATLGSTIANSLNTAVKAALGFGETLDWGQMGESIASGINSFFDTFDFATFGETLNTFVEGFAEFINGVFKDLDFEKIATSLNIFVDKLEEAVRIALTEIDWEYVFSAVKSLMTNLEFDTVAVIVGALTIKKIGTVAIGAAIKEALATKIAGLIGTITLPELTIAFASFAVGGNGMGTAGFDGIAMWVWNGIEDALYNLLPPEVNKFLGEFVAGFAIAGVASGGNPFIALAGGLIAPLKDILFDFSWAEELFTEAAESFKTAFDGNRQDILDIGGYIIDGIGVGIFGALALLIQPIDNVFRYIYEAFCDAFESHSPAETMTPIGKNIVLGIIKGFTGSVGEFLSTISGFANTVVSTFTTLPGKIWLELNTLKNRMIIAFTNIKTAFSNKWNEIVEWWDTSAIGKWWNEHVAPWFEEKNWTFEGIEDGLSSAFDAAIEAVKGLWNQFADWLNGKLTINIDTSSLIGQKIKELLGTDKITLGKLPTFQTGGFPEDGLFMANHNELLGKFSNGKTAVANNGQIIDGIKQGVTEAMMNVLMSMDSSNNQQTGETHVHVHFGSEELGVASFKAIKDGQRRGLIPQFQ